MNNNKKSSTKSYIILAIILILAVVVYFYTQGFKDPESDTLSISGEDDNIGMQVINLLNQVKSININPEIFSNPVYVTLMDNTVIVPVQNVGRANPFAPIPGVSNNTTKK